MTLTEDQRSFWAENGYLVVENVLSTADVERLRQAVTELEGRAAGLTESTDRFQLKVFGESSGRRVQQISEPHEIAPEWLALAQDRRILDIVEHLLGPNIQLYYSMLVMKPPREGFTAPWHQDFAFFVHDRADLLACMVAIDDATIENGCIRVVPGSHKLGLLNHFADGHFTESVQDDTSEFDNPERHRAVPAKAGSLILWHSLTLHSSQPNRSEKPRRAIVLEYKNPEARLMGGAFSASEVQAAGMMVRGRHPRGELRSAV